MRATNELNIVYFSSIDWNFTWQRPQQLASRLARFGKVLYVNPLGLRTVSSKDLARIIWRITFRLTPQLVTSLGQRVTIYSPIVYFPFPNNQIANRMNSWLQRRAAKSWMNRFGVRDPILWVSVPSMAVLETVKRLNCRFLVYDCIDNFAFFHKKQPSIAQAEQLLASKARIVFATSDELHTRMKQINPQTYLVPNAADFDHFAAASNLAPPDDVVQIRKPILGYTGEIAQWFDFDLVRDLAINNPNWSFVLIGQIQPDCEQRIRGLSNVHYLGRKSYAELPAYLNQFDVCLLPFEINALTSAVNPVKLYEYLAVGKPVVSTPLPEVLPFRNVVEIADRMDFSCAVRRALASSKEKAEIKQRVEIARSNTWDQRVEEIVRVLRSAS